MVRLNPKTKSSSGKSLKNHRTVTTMLLHLKTKLFFACPAIAALFGIAASSKAAAPAETDANATVYDTFVFVGTYTTGGSSKGIYLFKLQTGGRDTPTALQLIPLGLAADIANSSFLIIDKERQRLFAVTESNPVEGEPPGLVSAYSIEPATGKLNLLSRQSSRGAGPCHLALNPSGRHIVASNYYSGSVAVLPINKDGYLGDASDFVQYEGKSLHPTRQQGPHAHCATFHPTGRFIYVCDLGSDKVYSYRFDAQTGKLLPNDPAYLPITAGAGPRHLVFRQDGRFGYLINELNSTITVLAVNSKSGQLSETQTISLLPEDFNGSNTAAAIALHPTEKHLYASNRGHDSIVTFEVDAEDGTLTRVAAQSSLGRTPRHFDISRSGDLIVIANQGSDAIALWQVDPKNGQLIRSEAAAEVSQPACVVLFSPMKSEAAP
jgi:6-phosphogluconolactonase